MVWSCRVVWSWVMCRVVSHPHPETRGPQSLPGVVCPPLQVRELKRTHLLAVGAEAVTNAVLAVGNARLFLEENAMDIKVSQGALGGKFELWGRACAQ